MTIEELRDVLNFSADAITKKGIRIDRFNSAKVLINVSNQTIALDIREVGFDDEGGMVYIETEKR